MRSIACQAGTRSTACRVATRRGRRLSCRLAHTAAAGQGLLEFALVVPVVLLLIFGTIDLSRAIMSYVMVTNAAREGARYSVVNAGPALYPCTYQPGDPSNTLHCSTIITDALHVAPALDATSITAFTMAYSYFGAWDGSGGTLEAHVTITYAFHPLTLMLLGGRAITLSASAIYLRQ